jgi:hypothetical protein
VPRVCPVFGSPLRIDRRVDGALQQRSCFTLLISNASPAGDPIGWVIAHVVSSPFLLSFL